MFEYKKCDRNICYIILIWYLLYLILDEKIQLSRIKRKLNIISSFFLSNQVLTGLTFLSFYWQQQMINKTNEK